MSLLIKKERLSPQKKQVARTVTRDQSPVKKQTLKRKSAALKKEDNVDGETSDEPLKKKVKCKKETLTENVKEKKPKTAKVKSENCSDVDLGSVSWKVEDVISGNLDVPVWAAKNVVKLLDEGCTIPFIARYRKEQTGGMEVQKLRDTCTTLEELRSVESKVKSSKVAIHKLGKLTKQLDVALSNSVSVTEVDCLFAPFKPGNKGTLAERAKALGLEPLVMKFMTGNGLKSDADKLVNKNEKGLKTIDEIMNGVVHIMADMIHKHTAVMERVRDMSSKSGINISSSQIKQSTYQPKPGEKAEPAHKYTDYFDYSSSICRIQHHTVLALNRGEHYKILKIKVDIAPYLEQQMTEFCCRQWLHHHMNDDSRYVIETSIKDAYARLILPQITRLVRSNLTKAAEKSSIEVFATNLKNLLLSAPLKGCTILAVDPGFSNGCKSAVISKTGQILDTAVFYLHSMKNKQHNEINKLHNLILQHSCDVIAVGNGVACRETEMVVSEIIKRANTKLQYCIVSESGASIYSVSDAASKEMPDLDPSLRGAVSIGRRLLDPLSEYVKVDPKHLGVGQYQHDMPQNQLKMSLDSVIEECVSFVGVDINTCSECLLSHVSGLSAAKAKKILEFREKFGPFVCREQLMAVKGLGVKTYEQAAGFVRIHSEGKDLRLKKEVKDDAGSSKGKKGKTKKAVSEYLPEPLDMTWIHPESYKTANKLMEIIGVSVMNLGNSDFIKKVKKYMSSNSLSEISNELDVGEPTVKLIADALVRPLSYDLRDGFDKPLFKSGVKSMNDLKVGQRVTGKVLNVTNFGAFIDIGVERSALIHTTKMSLNGQRYFLKLGERVEGSIINVDIQKNRIGLSLIKIL